jgi:hypothetical protein
MNSNRWRNLHQYVALFTTFLLAALVGSTTRAQLMAQAVLYPPSVTSGTPNAANLVPFSATTGFSYTGHLNWSNVQTLGATLVMDMEDTLDPNYVAPGGQMIMGASMNGPATVPGVCNNMNCVPPLTPPDFVINYITLTTTIEAAVGYGGPNPYPAVSVTVPGPFHGGGAYPGLTVPFNVGNQAVFPYTYSPNFPIMRLRLTWGVDGMSVPGLFDIDFPASASFTPVPEPGAIALATLATSGLLLGARRTKRHFNRDLAPQLFEAGKQL